jgi:bifunctional non-homologous end joining protein LigD
MRWTKRRENGRRPEGVPRPSIPSIGKEVPSGPDWLHEVKHDGYRLMVRREGDDVLTLTRGGYDWTIRYPAISAAARRLAAPRFVIDGEGVVEGEGGIADFSLLHSRKHDRRCYLIAFDILQFGDMDLRPLPLEVRKRLLAKLLEGSTTGIVYAEHMADQAGVALFEAACRMGLEGIVSKRRDQPYVSGPCKHWIKVKNPDGAWKRRVEEP